MNNPGLDPTRDRKYKHALRMCVRPFTILCLLATFALVSCGVYRLKDVSIPENIKTVKINFIENRARYINPQLSPQLTDRFKQKVSNQTRLTLVQSDEADYDISGSITDYSVTTSGISNQQAASNRLNVSVHIILKNRKDEKGSFEADITRNFDFSSTLSLSQAEAQLNTSIISNLTDEMFNRIFSNW
jgi:Lipopolysaccharide-assembly